MPKANVFNMAGQQVGEIELSEAVFGIEPNQAVVHEVVKNHLANCRQGTQSALTRAEVSGGGKKPWRQKGTGHARQGSTRAPQWTHGGVISLNANGMEKNPGFRFTVPLILDAARALVYGDLFMRCLYRVRPYERTPGSANALHRSWEKRCIDSLTGPHSGREFPTLCRQIVEDFDAFPIDEALRKPRVGVVGEILVKYMPLANNHLVDLLEQEGAEAIVPDLMDFLNYCVYNAGYKHEFLGGTWRSAKVGDLAVKAIARIRRPAIQAQIGRASCRERV